MILKESYEVKKVEQPHEIRAKVPGSKSITNRALLIAALADGKSVLDGVLFSDDSRNFLQALIDLGFEVCVEEQKARVTITGCGGRIPCVSNKTKESTMDTPDASIYVGSAGTAARFLTAFLGLSKGWFRIDASEQMKKRPMKQLLVALEALGAVISYEEEEYHFPFVIGCPKHIATSTTVNVDESSQFLSALLISSVLFEEDFSVCVTGTHGMAYVQMTIEMMKQFHVTVTEERFTTGLTDEQGTRIIYHICKEASYKGLDYPIEPDLSAACYFYGAGAILGVKALVHGVHKNSLQGDIQFISVLEQMGMQVEEFETGICVSPKPGQEKELTGGTFDLSSFSDQALTLAAVAIYAKEPVVIANVGHIRFQECDRIHAILHNLELLGISASEEAGSITIYPKTQKISAAELPTFEDHRVAMAFSLAGLSEGNVTILDPSCCRKTFENYFECLEEMVY